MTLLLHCDAGPFSQRVMLTLGEKKVPFRKNFLDEDDLPEWCVYRCIALTPFRSAVPAKGLSDRVTERSATRGRLLMAAHPAVPSSSEVRSHAADTGALQ